MGGRHKLTPATQIVDGKHIQVVAGVDHGYGERTARDVVSRPLDVNDVLAHLGRVVTTPDCPITIFVLLHLYAERSYIVQS